MEWLQVRLPVWWFVLLTALCWLLFRRTAAAQFLRGLAAPVLNTKKDALSLGRTSLTGMLAAQVWYFIVNPQVFASLGWPPVVLLSLIDLFLLAYCFGDKPHIRELSLRLAERVSFSGAINSLPVLGGVLRGAEGLPIPHGNVPVPVLDAPAPGIPSHSTL